MFHLLCFLFTENDYGVGILPADVFSQRAGFYSIVRKIISVLFPLQTEQEKRESLACDKGYHGAEQGHHNACGEQQKYSPYRVPQGRYGRQITVTDGGQRDERVPAGVAKRADGCGAVGMFGQIEDKQEPDI